MNSQTDYDSAPQKIADIPLNAPCQLKAPDTPTEASIKTFLVTTHIYANFEADATKVRNELAARLADARDSSALPQGVDFVVNEVEPLATFHHQQLIELAQQRHCWGSDDTREVDSDARISRGDDGVFVQGWLFLSNDDLATAGIRRDGEPPSFAMEDI